MKLQCRRLLIPPSPLLRRLIKMRSVISPRDASLVTPWGIPLRSGEKRPSQARLPFAIRRRITRERVPAGWVVSPFAHAPASWASAHPSHLISAHCAHPPPYLFVAVLKLQPRPSRGLRRLHQAIFAHGDGVRPPCPAGRIRQRGGYCGRQFANMNPNISLLCLLLVAMAIRGF